LEENIRQWHINRDIQMSQELIVIVITRKESPGYTKISSDFALYPMLGMVCLGEEYFMAIPTPSHKFSLMLGNVHNSSCSVKLKRHVLGYCPWWVECWASYQRSMISESDELWDVLWAELDPDLAKIGFRNKISTHVQEVPGIHGQCDVNHTESHDAWLCPQWCECKPYGGRVRRDHRDFELKHAIGYKDKTLDR
jgi:hypothetical protein